MKGLSDRQLKERDDLVAELREFRDKIHAREKIVNHEIDRLNNSISDYNGVLQKIYIFREDVVDSLDPDEALEDENLQAFKEEWETSYADSIEEVPECTVEELKHDEDLLNLPENSDG